jgi:4-oxalocrotonate tautomerase
MMRAVPIAIPLKENAMPIVTIQVTREGTKPGAHAVTAEEKARLIEGASQLLLDVLNKPLEATFVVIEEVELENWGWGGLPVETYRKKLAAQSNVGRPSGDPRGDASAKS